MLTSAFLSLVLSADLPLVAPIFGDHMVLQRDQPTRVWGWAKPGQSIEVSVGREQTTTKVGPKGKWMVELKPQPAGGPYQLKVKGPREVVLRDIWMGEVWICSGQSNMEFGLTQCLNAAKEVQAANHPELRLFMVDRRVSRTPADLLGGEWKVCTPETVVQGGWGGFSGVGYAFGLKLMRELGVHVGLIQSAWGGTSVEAWTDRASVQSTHEYDDVLSLLDQETQKGMPEMATYFDRWMANFDPGTKADWWRNAPDGGWQSLPSGTPLKGDRIHWLRIRFQAAASAELLQLGELEGCDQTTLNGQLIGTGSGRWTRQYVIPKGLLRSGTNEVIIRLAPAYGGIGLHGKPDTIGLVTAGRFSTLASQVEARDGVLFNAAPPPKDIEANPTVPTLLFNGMIAPIAPLSVRGAIWYQGETNMGRGIEYRKLLPAFFASWRKAFRSTKLPIHVVSLANWTARLPEPAEAPMAELREAQFLTLRRDATSGLAMAYDVGDADDIHPKDKASVGLRLALCALAKNYGKAVEYSGPTLAKWTVQGDEIRLTFDHAKGLQLVNGGASFAVAGKDRKFVWAKARLEGSTVILTAPKGIQPVAARYAWANNPALGLVSGAGLPAVPFRTDDWPVTSSPRK